MPMKVSLHYSENSKYYIKTIKKAISYFLKVGYYKSSNQLIAKQKCWVSNNFQNNEI